MLCVHTMSLCLFRCSWIVLSGYSLGARTLNFIDTIPSLRVELLLVIPGTTNKYQAQEEPSNQSLKELRLRRLSITGLSDIFLDNMLVRLEINGFTSWPLQLIQLWLTMQLCYTLCLMLGRCYIMLVHCIY